MALHIAHIPRLILQKRASAILGMIIIAMLWFGLVLDHLQEAQRDFQGVERRNQNYARLFEENVLRSIGEIDKAILYLRRSIEAAKDTTDYQTIVMTTDVLSEIIVQVAIIDANGIGRGSNATSAPMTMVDLSDRQHFRVHLGADDDKLFISKPLIGRVSNRWSVQFTRRFSNKDGSFAGVVVASMDPIHFTRFYDNLDLSETTSVALIGDDGVVRSSGGGEAPRFAFGEDIAQTPLFERIRNGSEAAFWDYDTSADDGLFFTARKVRSYPLWVSVSTKESDIYKRSWATLEQNVLTASIMTILILIALEYILRAEAKAQQKAEQLGLTLEHISQGIMLVTKDGKIPIINERCGELLHLPRGAVDAPPSFDELARIGAETGTFAPPRDGEPGSAQPVPDGPRRLSISEYRKPNGVVIEVRKTRLPDGGFVQTFTDVTLQREAEARIARLAAEDPLTKLPNRRVFRARIEETISRHLRAPGDPRPTCAFAVLFLDVDRFKVVNDTLGHRIGDLLLIQLAKRLRSILPDDDVVARLGGDEFAVLLPSVDSRADIERVARDIVAAMEQPFQVDSHLISTSVSVGIAIGLHDGGTEDDVLVAADLALYAVKTSGRGTYRFYEKAMNEAVNDRRQIEIELREAIEQGQLELHYQPLVDLRRRRIIGFEALARWPHPAHGHVPTNKFIPVAEDCGLILPLGDWALTEACRTAVQWPDDLKISVNLSPVQLVKADFPQIVARILAETGLRPDRLELEITESIFLDDNEKTLEILHDIKELGVKIALDDFGTGYSSLSYLRSFPFDTLKIDRCFVCDLGADSESNVIAQSVILIAGGLGIRTVAEGVETDTQRQVLAALGCDAVQGYLFSRPVPASAVPALLVEQAPKAVKSSRRKIATKRSIG